MASEPFAAGFMKLRHPLETEPTAVAEVMEREQILIRRRAAVVIAYVACPHLKPH